MDLLISKLENLILKNKENTTNNMADGEIVDSTCQQNHYEKKFHDDDMVIFRNEVLTKTKKYISDFDLIFKSKEHYVEKLLEPVKYDLMVEREIELDKINLKYDELENQLKNVNSKILTHIEENMESYKQCYTKLEENIKNLSFVVDESKEKSQQPSSLKNFYSIYQSCSYFNEQEYQFESFKNNGLNYYNGVKNIIDFKKDDIKIFTREFGCTFNIILLENNFFACLFEEKSSIVILDKNLVQIKEISFRDDLKRNGNYTNQSMFVFKSTKVLLTGNIEVIHNNLIKKRKEIIASCVIIIDTITGQVNVTEIDECFKCFKLLEIINSQVYIDINSNNLIKFDKDNNLSIIKQNQFNSVFPEAFLKIGNTIMFFECPKKEETIGRELRLNYIFHIYKFDENFNFEPVRSLLIKSQRIKSFKQYTTDKIIIHCIDYYDISVFLVLDINTNKQYYLKSNLIRHPIEYLVVNNDNLLICQEDRNNNILIGLLKLNEPQLYEELLKTTTIDTLKSPVFLIIDKNNIFFKVSSKIFKLKVD